MDKINELIKQYPKHFSRMIGNDPILKKWVMDNTMLDLSNSFPAHVYSAINQVSNICRNGNQKKFKSINIGFAFCNSANKCQCCKESVSQLVSQSKQKMSSEQIASSNDKRVKTSLEKYGVTNNGQTPKAKIAHTEFYNDQTNKVRVIQQIKATKEERYGNSSYNNRTKAEHTCLTKYGVRNTWSKTDDKQNPNLELLRDKNKLTEVFPKLSVYDIAEKYAVHPQTVYHYLNLHGMREPYKSTFELEIIAFLKDLGITNIVSNDRKIIGKEIDIYLPDYSLAIEYNGVYWHHDRVPHINKTYHYDKFKLCESKGITLFSIFGNSWDTKKEIWKKKIKQKLNLSSHKIFARKTQVVEITSAETKNILNANHIQGYCTAKHCYGLKYNNEIVAVMTFSPKRAGIGKQREIGSYELVRYVTSYQVVGGASKLLNHFIKNVNPSSIYSYSDNQYSIGNMYHQIGFELEHENKCGYWYFDPIKRKAYHRFNFTKSKLVANGHDSKLTEYEIMSNLGYLRVWDCGSRTWIKKC